MTLERRSEEEILTQVVTEMGLPADDPEARRIIRKSFVYQGTILSERFRDLGKVVEAEVSALLRRLRRRLSSDAD